MIVSELTAQYIANLANNKGNASRKTNNICATSSFNCRRIYKALTRNPGVGCIQEFRGVRSIFFISQSFFNYSKDKCYDLRISDMKDEEIGKKWEVVLCLRFK